jgi:hypothetical protein
MRTGSIGLGLSFALLGVVACSDSSGPSYMNLEIVVDWPKLDEEGFVGDEYHFFGNCDLQNDLSIRCETFARGPIPAEWDGLVRVTVTCPIGEYTDSFQVSGYYEARGNEFGVCSGRIYPECTEGRQVLTVEEAPGFNGEPQPECSPPE